MPYLSEQSTPGMTAAPQDSRNEERKTIPCWEANTHLLPVFAVFVLAQLALPLGPGEASSDGGGGSSRLRKHATHPLGESRRRAHLLRVSLDGSGGQNKLDLEPPSTANSPLSPDHTKIAFMRDHDLGLMNADGTSPAAIALTRRAGILPAPRLADSLVTGCDEGRGQRVAPPAAEAAATSVLPTSTRFSSTSPASGWGDGLQSCLVAGRQASATRSTRCWATAPTSIGRSRYSNADSSASHLLPAARAIRRPAGYCWFTLVVAQRAHRVAEALQEGELLTGTGCASLVGRDTAHVLPGGRDPVWSPTSRLAFIRNISERSVLFMARATWRPCAARSRASVKTHRDLYGRRTAAGLPSGDLSTVRRSSYVVNRAATRPSACHARRARVPPLHSRRTRRRLYVARSRRPMASCER